MLFAATLITMFEGFMPNAYKDPVGIWTVGYGAIEYYDRPVQEGDTMTHQEAEAYMYAHMASDYAKIVRYNQIHGYNWNNRQIAALTSFTYNVGWNNFLQLTANGARSTSTIEKKMLLYVNAKGKKLNGLVRRRNVELCVFQSETALDAIDCINQ